MLSELKIMQLYPALLRVVDHVLLVNTVTSFLGEPLPTCRRYKNIISPGTPADRLEFL